MSIQILQVMLPFQNVTSLKEIFFHSLKGAFDHSKEWYSPARILLPVCILFYP